jgi:hypothetical protein
LLTNVPERVGKVESVGRLGSSDHYMIMAEIAVGKRKVLETGMVRNWWRADWASMRQELSEKNWDELDGLTASEAWTTFKAEVERVVDKNVPMKPRGAAGRPPWMNRQLLREVRKKRRIWKQRNDRTDEYRAQEKKVKNLIRNAKRQLEKKLALENNGNSKPFFAYLKSKLKSRTPVGPLKRKDGTVVNDSKEMAAVLNSYFSSVFTDEGDDPVPAADNCETGSKLENIRINEKMVMEKLKNLKPAAAPGPDGIGSMLLKELEEQVSKPLTAIYNKSLGTGDVPADWKRAHVTPIYKKGTKSDPSNYRPVSLTSICCKMLESMVRDSIVDHMSRNELIEDSQHGFVKSRSCATNLIEFLDYLTDILENGGTADAIFLDFAKAFDKVPRRRLIEKLRAIGIEGRVLTWIEEWLIGRQQRVVLQGETSTWEDVKSGVPQGSVLGPILFLIFIRDIDKAVGPENVVKKFADDTKAAGRADTDDDTGALQEVLNKMAAWAVKWKMEFNIKKCKVMHFGAANRRQQYTMDGHVLEETREERDIGVIVSNDLKPAAQCARAAKTATTVLGQITRSFQYRDKKIFLALYLRYVRPHLEFASQAWSPWYVKDIQMLEKVQKRAVSLINGLQSDTYVGKLKELGLQSLTERRKEADMVLTYKIVHGHLNVKGENWPKLVRERGRDAQHVTRSTADELKLRQPFARTDRRKNFFTLRACAAWNDLPLYIRRSKTVWQFKKNYKLFAASNTSEAMDNELDA